MPKPKWWKWSARSFAVYRILGVIIAFAALIIGWFSAKLPINYFFVFIVIALIGSAVSWALYIGGITIVLQQSLRVLYIAAMAGTTMIVFWVLAALLDRVVRLNLALYTTLLVTAGGIGLVVGGYLGNIFWKRRFRQLYEPA